MEQKKITLEPIERFDLGLLKEWRNDPEIMQRTRQWRELTDEDQSVWFETLYKGKWPENLMWTIRIDDDERVGVCGLCHTDWIGRSAEVSIYVGDKEWQNKGIATEAIQQLKSIAFDRLNLDNIWAENYVLNTINKKLLLKCGFAYGGYRVKSVYKNGRYWNSEFFYFLKENYGSQE